MEVTVLGQGGCWSDYSLKNVSELLLLLPKTCVLAMMSMYDVQSTLMQIFYPLEPNKPMKGGKSVVNELPSNREW